MQADGADERGLANSISDRLIHLPSEFCFEPKNGFSKRKSTAIAGRISFRFHMT
jgi:hypothetical protein